MGASGSGRRRPGFAIALSIALHAVLLAVAGLVLAGVERVEAPASELVSWRLDLRAAPRTSPDSEPIRLAEPVRAGIPPGIEPTPVPIEPLDHDAWADELEISVRPGPVTDSLVPPGYPDVDARNGAKHAPRRRPEGAAALAAAEGPRADSALVSTGSSGTGGDGGSLGDPGREAVPGGGGTDPAGRALADQPPRAVSTPRPEYPEDARKRGEQGAVTCRIRVQPDGGVERVEVLVSSGSECLDRAAVEALERWRYEPARLRGAATACVVQQVIRFTLAR
ncbi:MAG: energy transducer TonB [Planctomycetota bacterium]|nr:energy transducer TonB [Planctomycetota bacterium]